MTRLLLVRRFGDAFEDPIDDVVGWIGDHRIRLAWSLSVGLVVLERIELHNGFHYGLIIPTKALVSRNQKAKGCAPIAQMIIAFHGIAAGA